jgi:AraC-like DNA-binding protein
MTFNFGFYSSLLLIFFVHLLVFSGLVLRKSTLNDAKADRWLSLLLLLGALFIAPWMLGFGGWYGEQPYRDFLFYVPFNHALLIGPVVYFYVQAQLNPDFKLYKNQYLHFIPAALWVVFHIVSVVTDKLILKEYYFLASGSDPDFVEWYQFLGLTSLVCYLVLTYRYYAHYQRFIYQIVSNADAVRFKWIRNFLVAFLVFVVLTFIFTLLPLVGVPLDYRGSWWYFFFFGFLFYYISIEGFSNVKSNKIAIEELSKEIEDEAITPKSQVIEDLELWKTKVLKNVVEEQNYINPELSLPDLAKSLRTNPSFLSKVVNQGFGQNFNDFVNEKRVLAVVEKLKAGEQKQLTLLAIAYDCGFNSKATFNRAFKKATGQSPKYFEG